jgi:hydroxyacylglutathione hydrolase
MEVYQINSSPYDANAYLIISPEPVLIDVGMNARYVLDTISALIESNNIETIILTHGHYDHWGAAEMVRHVTGADIAIHTEDAAFLSNDVSSAAAMFGAAPSAFKPDRLLIDGDLIELGDSSNLKILHTPGHTPGCICLYHATSKSLFSGDTVFQGGGFGRTDMIGGDHRLLIASLQRLSELDVKVMYPGHGPVTDEDATGQIQLSLHLAATGFALRPD